MHRAVDVAIVGGGISGLTLAWRLSQRRPDLKVVVLEAESRTGGKILTERVEVDGDVFLVEGGPDAILTQKPDALALIDELGLSDQVIPIAQGMPATTLRNGRPVATPDGLRLITPTRFWPFMRSPLLSPLGKLRLWLDLVLPRRGEGRDESQAAFVRRRFGQEAVDRIGEPIIAGIHNGDPERLSIQATFPQLVALEHQHRSLILGQLAANRRRGKAPAKPPFVTLRDGMATLPDVLARRLESVVRLNCEVGSIHRQDGGFVLKLADGETLIAHQVILTTPASVSARLLGELAPVAATRLGELRTIGAGSISLAYRTPAIARPLPGYGLVIPQVERRPINAVTVASSKFAGRAGAGWTLLRVFFGGVRSPETLLLDPDVLLQTTHRELQDLLGVMEPPVLHRIVRWPVGNPQYDVGHLDQVKSIEDALPDGVLVTGSPYHGVGIPDVVRSANATAETVLQRLQR